MDDDRELRLVDVQSDLGSELGGLLPWLEPAIRLLSSDRFGVAERESALTIAGNTFIENYADGFSLANLNVQGLESLAGRLLGEWVIVKARELQLRAARDSI